jgi:hypothetical protein
MMSVLSILNELASDNSRLVKEAILKREVNNETLKKVFVAAYNPHINYWIMKIPEYRPDVRPVLTLEAALGKLSGLSERKFTGNNGITFLSLLLSELSEDDAIVIQRIIQRDLKCGVNEPTINKIWNGLIPTFDVMLAHKDVSGIKYPAYCQTKQDGMRVHIHYDGTNVQAFTRNGKTVDLKGKFDRTASEVMRPGETWDGELLCHDGHKILDRKTGNGICNKALRGTISDNEASMLFFVTWDIVDFPGTKPYTERWNKLVSRMSDYPAGKFRLVHSVVVNSVDEVQVEFDKAIHAGEEGVIVKNMNAVWQPKRTKDLGKVKAELECDLVVTGWIEGEGKYVGMMGALPCETSDGLLTVNIGGGWSDEERKTIKPDVVGSVLTVLYNQLITDKNTGKYSLFLPRKVELRSDKDVANKIEELEDYKP